MPPSRYSVWPVMKSDAGEAKNSTALRTSSGSAMRPSGIRADQGVVEIRVGEHARHLLRAHEGRRHRVDVDLVRRPLGRELLAEDRQAALRRAVRRDTRARAARAASAPSRCGPACRLPLRDHVPRGRLRLEHRALQVQRHDLVEVRCRELLRLLLALPADQFTRISSRPKCAATSSTMPLGVGYRESVERGHEASSPGRSRRRTPSPSPALWPATRNLRSAGPRARGRPARRCRRTRRSPAPLSHRTGTRNQGRSSLNGLTRPTLGSQENRCESITASYRQYQKCSKMTLAGGGCSW